MKRVALLAASNYSRAQTMSPLLWSCADVASIGRHLVTHCGFDRVIVLNGHDAPSAHAGHPAYEPFSEGQIRGIATVIHRLSKSAGTKRYSIADSVLSAGGMYAEERAEIEAANLRPDFAKDPGTQQADEQLRRSLDEYYTARLEGLVVHALNSYMHETGTPRKELYVLMPELDPEWPGAGSTPASPPLVFKGVANRSAVIDAAQELEDLLEPDGLFLFVFSGHGFDEEGQSFLLLPDADKRRSFTRASSLRLADLRRKFGFQVMLLDMCRCDPDGFTRPAAPGTRTGAKSAGEIVARNAIGDLPNGLAAPRGGSIGILQGCWSGQETFESRGLRRGNLSRILSEGILGGAWANNALTFEQLTRFAERELRLLSAANAEKTGTNLHAQQAFVHWSGLPVPLVLGDNVPTPQRDARLWGGVPRLSRVIPGVEFRLNTLELPFVHLTTTINHKTHAPTETLMAIHPVRVCDFRRFAAATGQSIPEQPAGSQEDWPIVNLPCKRALEFAQWLTDIDHRSGLIPPGFAYGLPTDAEFDRALGLPHDEAQPIPRLRGAEWNWPWENGRAIPGVHFAQPPGPAASNTGPIAVGAATPLTPQGGWNPTPGICGLVGNIWEMVADLYDKSEFPEFTTLRGQSWRTPPSQGNLCARDCLSPTGARDDVGFRLVLRGW